MRTRIAPTPSGYLHYGNLFNFGLTKRLSEQLGLSLGLRIDDIDRARFRPEYLKDIFEKISALDIQPKFGPTNEAEFESTYSQINRNSIYLTALRQIATGQERIFVCTCSRTELENRRCVRNCSSQKYDLKINQSVMRFRSAYGDEVLWRREGIPSYLLTDYVDDIETGITHIVRGIDLFEPTQIQIELREITNAQKPTYIFHQLIAKTGVKLSKSTGAQQSEITERDVQWISELVDSKFESVLDQVTNPIESPDSLDQLDIDLL